MKKILLLMITSLLVVLFFANSLYAGTIEKGTFSIGAGTGAFFRSQSSDQNDNDDDFSVFNFNIEGSYFVIDNLEVGLIWNYYRKNNTKLSDGFEYDYSQYLMAPFIGYHHPLSSSSNLYIRAGVGMGHGERDYEDFSNGYEIDITTFFGEAGWEYFIRPSVALNLGLEYEKTDYDYSIYREKDESITDFSGNCRFRIYF